MGAVKRARENNPGSKASSNLKQGLVTSRKAKEGPASALWDRTA
jgi:hypothetical protein